MQQGERLLGKAREAAEHGEVTEADALFAQVDAQLRRAGELDRKWDQPHALQAAAHERKAWMSYLDPRSDPAEHLRLGRAAAEQAIARNQQSAAGYEARGRIAVAEYMLTKGDAAKGAELLKAAEADFGKAIALDPDRARAESMLSMLYEMQGRFAAARQAAERALEADAYLEDANQILVRLFETSFELNDDEAAGHWCDEIRRRFTGLWPAAYCDLVMLGWRNDGKTDARKALHILQTFGEREPQALRAMMQPRLSLLAGVTLARAGDIAGARKIIDEARASGRGDPELPRFEAALRVELREYAEASRLLKAYLAQNPNARARTENGRMFKMLRASLQTRAAN